MRQLNFYGFRKVGFDESQSGLPRDRKSWEFKHEKFLRDEPELMKDIRRKTCSEAGTCAREHAGRGGGGGVDVGAGSRVLGCCACVAVAAAAAAPANKAEIDTIKEEVRQLKRTIGEVRETMNNMSLVLMRALSGARQAPACALRARSALTRGRAGPQAMHPASRPTPCSRRR